MTTVTEPVTFQTDAVRSAITAEQLALIGFASSLGTCVNNDDTGSKKAKSVRDEAKLLMSLLMGKKASDILSEEIGVRDEDDSDTDDVASEPKESVGDFTFTFPALSLQPGSSSRHGNAESDATQNEEGEMPPPSELLARLQSVNDKDAVKTCSETMAQNVLESFGSALIWRAKTWVNSLAQVLTVKFNESSKSDSNETINNESDGEQEDTNFDVDSIINSREMQIIESIVRSSEEVSVVNVETNFRVMPQRIEDSPEPAAKKPKTESDDAENITCKVIHKLHFEAVVSMTSNEGDRYKKIKLQAPGSIEGIFLARINSGDDILRGVSIKLDTNAFALSLERESRSVVRRAAEAALLAASGIDITDLAGVHHSVISPKYVLMSPMQQHDGSDHETDLTQSTFSTAIPSHASSGEDGVYSDSSAVTTPPVTPSKTSGASYIPQSPSPAPLEPSV